ncbi:hypothetical protein [Natrialba sp. PRR66]|nr:hypothetical protein [Natrialba sp. PRR66]
MVEQDADTDERDSSCHCDLCGDRVQVAIYREHLLKECPGR